MKILFLFLFLFLMDACWCVCGGIYYAWWNFHHNQDITGSLEFTIISVVVFICILYFLLKKIPNSSGHNYGLNEWVQFIFFLIYLIGGLGGLSSVITAFNSHEGLMASAPAFFAKAEMGSVRFQQRKISWRLLPSAARVRPAPVAVHNSPSVRCALLTYANDFTPCRDVLAF